MEEVGDTSQHIIIKSDQEPAVECVLKDLVEKRGGEGRGRTYIEEAPKRSGGSNGVAERAVQEVEGQIRVLFFGLAGKVG